MIEHYSFGRIEVRGRAYSSDVIIYPDRVDDGWWRREGHSLCMADLRDVVAAEPAVLVVGTGAHGAMDVPDDVRARLADLGIDLRVAKTGEACTIYNGLPSDSQAVAALHLTC